MNKITELIDAILKDYPSLESHPTAEGAEIWLSERGDKDDDECLVGSYTNHAVESGELSEADIREDCEAFLDSEK